MSLRKAASMGAVQSMVSMVSGFASVKITSVFLGPAGIGVLSQLQYFMAMAQNGLMSGLNTGVVRRTAECGGDEDRRALVVSTVLRLLLCLGLPVALLIAVFSQALATELLHEPTLQAPLLLFSGTYMLALLAALVASTANGAKDYRTTATINIATVLGSLGLYALLCPTFGLAGGLVGAALVPLVTLGVAWFTARRRPWWPRRPFAAGFSGSEARLALAFVPMAAVGAISQPLVQILIRQELALHHGMATVGMLQGVMRISEMYLNIATTVLAMYYLPRFSELRAAGPLWKELRRALLIIVPAIGGVSLLIYLLRDVIIQIVLTREFLPMRELFGWQMTGNVFKIVAWLLGTLLVAKGHPLWLAGFELATSLLWWWLGVTAVDDAGAQGAARAYALTYMAYSAVALGWIAWVFRRLRSADAAATPSKE